MDRRELLLGAAAAALASTAMAEDHSHHQHLHGKNKNQSLLESAAHCVVTGEICLDHCHDLLGEGDKVMADCARSVNQLIAVCSALRTLAAQDAKQLGKMAKVAMEVCKECENDCRKHEKKHAQCKDCADACADCAKECQKLTT